MNKAFILERLKEASTWRSIIYVMAAAGVPLAPAVAQQVIATGMAVAGLIGIFMPDQIGKSQ